nr:DUF2589 domain-containing protein [uncultured Desulfobacter sp.]
MAKHESLDNLIEGLAGAVVEAQSRIEEHQIKNFLSYFDKYHRPKNFDVLVPSLHPDKAGEDARYRVPLLTVVANSLLRIKEVEISFDTDLVGVSALEDGDTPDVQSGSEPGNEPGKKLKSINLDLRGSGVFKKKSGTAHVVMKVEGQDISEGMARLVDRLLQTQGDID